MCLPVFFIHKINMYILLVPLLYSLIFFLQFICKTKKWQKARVCLFNGSMLQFSVGVCVCVYVKKGISEHIIIGEGAFNLLYSSA